MGLYFTVAAREAVGGGGMPRADHGEASRARSWQDYAVEGLGLHPEGNEELAKSFKQLSDLFKSAS